MDHFQSHEHPLPQPSHASAFSWMPKFHLPQPSDWHHPDPGTLPQGTQAPHQHFHFPPLSTHSHTLSSHLNGNIDSVAHLAQPPTPTAPPTLLPDGNPPWAPRADIRETKHAYHIEIELPGVTDKSATTIHWLAHGMLLVRGEIRRPDLHRDVHAATAGTEATDTNKQPTAHLHEGAIPETEKFDTDSDARNPTHAPDPSANGSPLTRSLTTREQEALRERSMSGSGSGSAPTPTPAPASSPKPMFLLSERKVGLWQRTFTLPLDVDAMGMKASLDAGLLEILLMKRCVDMGKAVAVEVS